MQAPLFDNRSSRSSPLTILRKGPASVRVLREGGNGSESAYQREVSKDHGLRLIFN